MPRPNAVSIALGILSVWLTLVACTPVTKPVAPTVDGAHPILTDLWDGRAHFVMDVRDTGLPMGESDTIVLPDGVLRSYLHAGNQSLGVLDQCGDPVAFPGCLVLFESHDGGRSFAPQQTGGAPICLLPCAACPCDSRRDQVDQQQYPRVVVQPPDGTIAPAAWWLVYEYRANIILRRSADGIAWSSPRELPLTGIWRNWLMACPPAAAIGPHPNADAAFDCLVGSPPGLYLDDQVFPPELYIFVGVGQNPGAMGCYHGPADAPSALFKVCNQSPLFTGSATYGPLDVTGVRANAYFDFRTISSAELLRAGDYVYMLYEGVRGPAPDDDGDTQFLLGLARAPANRIDGPWEKYPDNPILLDLPGNVGVGHADLVVLDGVTYLYTSLDGVVRSRLRLDWTDASR